jgi:hypothetical protein
MGMNIFTRACILMAVLIIGGCGAGTTETDPDNGLKTSSDARACTYTAFAGQPKRCTNIAPRFCTKYSYGTIGDESASSYSRCSDLGY